MVNVQVLKLPSPPLLKKLQNYQRDRHSSLYANFDGGLWVAAKHKISKVHLAIPTYLIGPQTTILNTQVAAQLKASTSDKHEIRNSGINAHMTMCMITPLLGCQDVEAAHVAKGTVGPADDPSKPATTPCKSTVSMHKALNIASPQLHPVLAFFFDLAAGVLMCPTCAFWDELADARFTKGMMSGISVLS